MIKTESDNPKKLKVVLQNFYMKSPSTAWMNISNFTTVKFAYDWDTHTKTYFFGIAYFFSVDQSVL
jgi:hypothetical protein